MEPDELRPPAEPSSPTWAEIGPDEGGDPACWAHELCEECGSALSDGHREDCPLRDQQR